MLTQKCVYHTVKVPIGFNYDAVEALLQEETSSEKEPFSKEEQDYLANKCCYHCLQLEIQDYRSKFEANFIDGKDGSFTIDFEYQTFPFYYELHPPTPVDWGRDSVEDMIHKADFWDRF